MTPATTMPSTTGQNAIFVPKVMPTTSATTPGSIANGAPRRSRSASTVDSVEHTSIVRNGTTSRLGKPSAGGSAVSRPFHE